MITYTKKFIGLNLLFRAHGSAIYKAFIPGFISVAIFLIFDLLWHDEPVEAGELNHPYGVGVLISSVSFLIVFRANYGYQRYWEACGAVHHMMSKWLDAIVHTSVYHMQQSHYNPIKPPSYYDHHELNKLYLKRDRERDIDLKSESEEHQSSIRQRRKTTRSIEKVGSKMSEESGARNDPLYLIGEGRLDGGWGKLFNDDTSTYYKKGVDGKPFNTDVGFASTEGGRTPALFLQELAHLCSLCVAVAFSTLRNDIEGAESPLDMYYPGQPWPEVDPDKMDSLERKEFFPSWSKLQYYAGFDRSIHQRTRYNATRPLLVLGGVSDNEIKFLQKARGPSAKVTLAWHWLTEFIIREHLAGSLGDVGPPIISRIIQFLSDGMIYYNHARKIMFIPFPFPHAQISALFTVVIIFCVPLLMDQYARGAVLGAILTFFTTTCLAGLHEVARELENPFRNAPNDIPLCTLLSQFNESLITMYAGYHPDHFWDASQYHEKNKPSRNQSEEKEVVAQCSEQAKPVDSQKYLETSEEFKELRRLVAEQAKEIKRMVATLESLEERKTLQDEDLSMSGSSDL